METNKPQSICNILGEDKYIIPIYQRNFEWGKEQIEQLIWDINDYNGMYYLGTLVVFKRNDDSFEVIDGQQRLTALNLIQAYLKNKQSKICEQIKKCNLSFEVRKECDNFLNDILEKYENAKNNENVDSSCISMQAGIEIIESFFTNNSDYKIDDFSKKFYEQTFLFRVELPKNTDLNHYFEIMNNRGEQLEKHEILKAHLMSSIPEEKQTEFAKIWDACSQMDSHVIQNFQSDERDKYFDREYFFAGITTEQKIETENEKNKQDSLSDLLKNVIGENSNAMRESNDEKLEKYKSIIDFPNFLLFVLKLENKNSQISLDDKKLLKEFEKFKDNKKYTEYFSTKFINTLFKYRKLFDNYVVKRVFESEENWNWKIQTLNEKLESQNTFKKADGYNTDNGYKIIILQSMLQVSFSSNSYKHWLFELMKALNENIEENKIIECLENHSKDYFKDKDLNLHNGTNTNRFIFNYLDYLLWCKYQNEIRGKDTVEKPDDHILMMILNVKEKFNNFKFTERNSIEHLFPQNKRKEIEENGFTIDNFGNLCLVSSQRNSLYRDKYPLAKKEDFNSRNKESLKQILMFEEIMRENDWTKDKIISHGKEMIDILIKSFCPSYKNDGKTDDNVNNCYYGICKNLEKNITILLNTIFTS